MGSVIGGVDRPLIVVTPVKEEDWILTSFLDEAIKYADYVILNVQGALRVNRRHRENKKIVFIFDQDSDFDENRIRNKLLEAARRIAPNSAIISLDADEFLSPECFDEGGLIDHLRAGEPGEGFSLRLLNVSPDLESGWLAGEVPMARIDNGENLDSKLSIHKPRLPVSNQRKSECLGFLMHMQFIDWSRMSSKHVWYQMWEQLAFPQRGSFFRLHRRYHHMFGVANKDRVRLLPRHLQMLQAIQVSLVIARSKKVGYRWDTEIRDWIDFHGEERFKLLEIWGHLEKMGLKRPRLSSIQKFFLAYLNLTMPLANFTRLTPLRLLIRLVDIPMSAAAKLADCRG